MRVCVCVCRICLCLCFSVSAASKSVSGQCKVIIRYISKAQVLASDQPLVAELAQGMRAKRIFRMPSAASSRGRASTITTAITIDNKLLILNLVLVLLLLIIQKDSAFFKLMFVLFIKLVFTILFHFKYCLN